MERDNLRPAELDEELTLDVLVEKTGGRLVCVALLVCSIILTICLRENLSYLWTGIVFVDLAAAIWIGIEKDLVRGEEVLKVGATGMFVPFLLFRRLIPWCRIAKVKVHSTNKESTAVVVEVMLDNDDSSKVLCTRLTPGDIDLLLLHLYLRAPAVNLDWNLRSKAVRVNELEAVSPRNRPIEWSRKESCSMDSRLLEGLDLRLLESRPRGPRLMKIRARKPSLLLENEPLTKASDSCDVRSS